MRRLIAAVTLVILLSGVGGVLAASGPLPTSVCSDGNGFHTIYTPHSGGNQTIMQTWGELVCNQTNRYHKIEIYYYYNGTHEWKRVAYVERYTTGTYDQLILNQCAQPANEAHAWQARTYVGGGHEGWSAVKYLNVRIAADGSC